MFYFFMLLMAIFVIVVNVSNAFAWWNLKNLSMFILSCVMVVMGILLARDCIYRLTGY